LPESLQTWILVGGNSQESLAPGTVAENQIAAMSAICPQGNLTIQNKPLTSEDAVSQLSWDSLATERHTVNEPHNATSLNATISSTHEQALPRSANSITSG